MQISIWFSGPAGSGVNTAGILLAELLAQKGYTVLGDKEYASIIKGDNNCFFLYISSLLMIPMQWARMKASTIWKRFLWSKMRSANTRIPLLLDQLSKFLGSAWRKENHSWSSNSQKRSSPLRWWIRIFWIWKQVISILFKTAVKPVIL